MQRIHQLVRAGLGVMLAAAAASPGMVAAQGGTAPRITRVAVANNSFNTAERTVALHMTTDGPEPTAFRASERADMSGAVWRSITSSPSFTLSSTPGRKVVFVQVGKSATISTTTAKTTQTVVSRLPGDFVVAPSLVSNIVGDTIVLGLPDLRSTVEMPSTVRDGTKFNINIVISNAGQLNPVAETINVYNSFVTNTIAIESVFVPFGVSRLIGKGCVITDVPTIECTLAPMSPGAAVGIQLVATVMRGLQPSQTQVTHSLRTRINGVRESDIANNWRDTPITIVK